MEGSSLGQRVAAALLPYLAEVTGGRPGEAGARREPRGVRQARQLWEELSPHVAARPELTRVTERAADSASGTARRALAARLQVLFQDDPRLAERVRYRLETADRRDVLRQRLRQGWPVALLAVSVVAVVIVLVRLDDELWAGNRIADDVALAVIGLCVVTVLIYVVYRRFPRAMNWVLVGLVVPPMILAIDPEFPTVDADRAKILAIFVLTLLPGWLYMQFVATRGRSLWEAYVTNLFRLRADSYRNLPEPPRGTDEHEQWAACGGPHADDPGMLYRRKFEAAYASTVTYGGSEDAAGARVRGEGFAPVWIMTLLTAFGWVAVLAPTYHNAMVFGSGRLMLGGGGPATVPLWEALAFGFVGAYWFNLQSLVRRYFQNDLRTNAYISAIARYIVVAILVAVAFAVRELLGADAGTPAGTDAVPAWFNGLAFAIGVFPNLGLQIIMKAVTKVVGRVADLENQFPLTHLDGLNMWYEARLVEEGIEDLENLATADVVDLLLATRVPVGRTVDWIDQAYLYLRVSHPEQRRRLRALGIRTATDLQDAFPAGHAATPAASWPSRAELVAGVLHPDGVADPVSAVDILLASLDGEPNLRHVRAWRRFDPQTAQAPPPPAATPEAPLVAGASASATPNGQSGEPVTAGGPRGAGELASTAGSGPDQADPPHGRSDTTMTEHDTTLPTLEETEPVILEEIDDAGPEPPSEWDPDAHDADDVMPGVDVTDSEEVA